MPQYAVKTVQNLQILDYNTKKPIIPFINYATVTSNSIAATRTDINGGQGNQRLYSFDESKTSDLQVTTSLVDATLLAFLSGGSVASGAAKIFKREVLTVDATNKVTLSQTPITGTIVLSNTVDGQPRDFGTEVTVGDPTTNEDEYSITGSQVTLNSTAFPQGTTIIAFYQYNSPSSTQTIKIDSDKFANFCTIVGDTLWADQSTATNIPMQMYVYKARAQSGITLSMDTANATTLQLTFDMYAEYLPAEDRNAYVDYHVLS